MDMLTRLIYRADVPGLHAGDEPYWRGYIWININYLALRALHQLKGTTGEPPPLKTSESRRIQALLAGWSDELRLR